MDPGLQNRQSNHLQFRLFRPAAETVLLGIVAYRSGKKFEYDGATGQITNTTAANQYLTREYRKGWEFNFMKKLSASLHLCAFALTAFLGFGAQAKSDRPNIFFIMADDHAAHAISAYGSKINKTPNIDRIAQ